MSEEREQAWAIASKGWMRQMAVAANPSISTWWHAGYDAANARAVRLEAALRSAREALVTIGQKPHRPLVYALTVSPALAAIDTALGEQP